MKKCLSCQHCFTSSNWTCPVCSFSPPLKDGYPTFASELANINEGFEPQFFAQLAQLEQKHFWFRSRNRLIIWALKKYFATAKNFLEIGCGTGFVLTEIEQNFPNLELYGSEIFIAGLKIANQRLSQVHLIQMDGRNIPFDNQFNVIGAFDVLEHIKKDTEVLKQMYHATCLGGGILLTVPQHSWLWSYSDEYAHHVRRYQAKDLKIKVEQAGFRVAKMTSFVSLLLPLMFLSRWQQRQLKAKADPIAEFRISPWLNAILETILNQERIFIEQGFSFPLGGSLLLVAHKS